MEFFTSAVSDEIIVDDEDIFNYDDLDDPDAPA